MKLACLSRSSPYLGLFMIRHLLEVNSELPFFFWSSVQDRNSKEQRKSCVLLGSVLLDLNELFNVRTTAKSVGTPPSYMAILFLLARLN